MLREPKIIAALRRAIQPHDYRVFTGVIDRRRWPAPSHLLYHACGGRYGDNRDRPEIDAWADDIAHALRADPRSRPAGDPGAYAYPP
jgi:menaquinone-dependent protoporphyrinogen oxidase